MNKFLDKLALYILIILVFGLLFMGIVGIVYTCIKIPKFMFVPLSIFVIFWSTYRVNTKVNRDK